MDQAALVMDEIEAGANLIRRLHAFAEIKVAFWLRRDEDDRKELYLASDWFASANRPKAYGEVARILDEQPMIFLRSDEVTLLPGDNRWAVAAQEWSKDRLGTKLRSTMFAGEYVADAYIYPSPLPEDFPHAYRPAR